MGRGALPERWLRRGWLSSPVAPLSEERESGRVVLRFDSSACAVGDGEEAVICGGGGGSGTQTAGALPSFPLER